LEYEHDWRYFLEDGDVILRVEHTLFRVHREKLGAVKGLFAQMFSLPQPENSDKSGLDHLYGIPCCDIYLVSAIDMHFTLGFIYGDL